LADFSSGLAGLGLHAMPLEVGQTEVVLRLGVTEGRRLLVPADRYFRVRDHTLAHVVHVTEIELRLDVSSLGKGSPDLERLCVVGGLVGFQPVCEGVARALRLGDCDGERTHE
jgi:hypothetical protein